MARTLLILLVSMLAVAGPSMALVINVDTDIPPYIMDSFLNMTGTIEPTPESWTDNDDVDFIQGSPSSVRVAQGSVILSPYLNFTILNNSKPVFWGANASDWDVYLSNKNLVHTGGTYYMYYSASATPSGAKNIGLATSSNGISWSRYSGNPILKAGVDSYDYGQLDWPVVIIEGSTWKMWYAGNSSANDVNICYATSSDGKSWTKYSSNPVVTKGSNAADFDGYAARPIGVHKSNGNYSLYYEGTGAENVPRLGLAKSTDGVSWTKSSFNPLYKGEAGAWHGGVFHFTTLDEAHGTYRIFGWGGTSQTSLGWISSDDGINWRDSGGTILTTKPGTIYSVDMAYNHFIYHGTNYHMNMLCVNETQEAYGAFRIWIDNLTGTYTSRQFTINGEVTLQNMSFKATVPEGGRLDMYIRWYNRTNDPVVWRSVDSGFNYAGVTAKYFQYRADFIALRDWFRVSLDEVTLDYTVNVQDVKVRVGSLGNWLPTNGTPLSWWVNVSLPDGDYVLSICATDTTGQRFLKNMNIRVDLYPPSGNIVIEGGLVATNSTTLDYALSAADTHGVAEMMVSTDPLFSGARWVDYDTSGTLQWTGPDGVVPIYVKFKDTIGRESAAFNDTIIVDTSPPVGSLSINDGAGYTNTRAVTLNLDFTDLTGVVSMLVSNRPDFAGSKWRNPANMVNWTLEDVDGTQTVYVRLKDMFEATSTISDQIVLDRVAPSIVLTLDGGAVFTTDLDVELVADITDASPIMGKMWNTGDDEPEEPSAFTAHTKTTWTLTDGADGPRGVEIVIVDAAGNEARKVVNIGLDRTPPIVTLLLDDGAEYTRESVVTVTLEATDATAGIDKMRVSSSGDFTALPWEALKTSFGWPIGTEDGTQFVYVQVSDKAGLITTVSGTIILDTTAPSGSFAIDDDAAYTTDRTVELRLRFTDDFELEGMRVGDSPDLSTVEWGPFVNLTQHELPEEEGERIVWVEVRDMAGNTFRTSASIVLDISDPVVSVSIEDGAEATYSLDAEVMWTASDAHGLVEVWFSTNPQFTGATPVVLDNLKVVDSVRNIAFSGTDGRKTVYVRVRDAAGRMAVASDDIWFVSEAPGGTIVAGDGTGWTNTTHVAVRITNPVGSPTHVRVSNTKAGLASVPWERLIDPHAVDLPSGDGEKTFFVEMLADHNLSSGAKNVTITLDTGKPTLEVRKSLPKSTSDSSVVLDVGGRDMLDPTPLVRWRVNDGQWFDVGATPPTIKLKDGRNTIDVQVIDAAGNTAEQTFTVEREGGLGAMLIAIVVIVVAAVALVVLILMKRGAKGGGGKPKKAPAKE